MCEHLEGCSMLEGGSPRNALLLCARKEDNEREREREKHPDPTGSPMGMPIR